MMTRSKRPRIAFRGPVAAALAGTLIGLQPAWAQDSGSVTVDVGDCVKIESAADRLACFEARVNAVLDEREAPAANSEVAEREAAERQAAERQAAERQAAERQAAERQAAERQAAERQAAERQAAESRRRSADELPTPSEQAATRAERRAERARDSGVEYVGKVASFQERLPNSLVITLENGQVWEQTSPKRYALRPGYEVVISESNWGEAYRLHAPAAGGYILVRRVR